MTTDPNHTLFLERYTSRGARAFQAPAGEAQDDGALTKYLRDVGLGAKGVRIHVGRKADIFTQVLGETHEA